jgi:hypothetical protein
MATNNPLDGNLPLSGDPPQSTKTTSSLPNDQLTPFRAGTLPIAGTQFEARNYSFYASPVFEQVSFTPHWRPDAQTDAANNYDVGPDFGDDVGPPGSSRNGAPPRLSVELNDSPSANDANPNDRRKYTVKIEKNGDVTLNGNVLTKDELDNPPIGQDLVIRVDASKEIQPNDQQNAKLRSLTENWASLIQHTFADQLPEGQNVDGAIVPRVQIDDESHLVPPDVHQKFGNDVPPVQTPMNLDLPEGSTGLQSMSNSMDAMRASGTGVQTYRQQDIQQQIPQRDADVPVTNSDVVPTLQATLDTTAALNRLPTETGSNYDAIHKQPNGIFRIGRYGIRQELVQSAVLDTFTKYLTPDQLKLVGDPPPKDWASLMQVLKDHPELMDAFKLAMKNAILEIARKLIEEAKKKNDDEHDHIKKFGTTLEAFANKFTDDPNFAKGFADFITKLDGKHGDVTQAEVTKYMPKEFQEFVVQNRQQAFAAAIVSDHNPDHMTADEAAKVVLAIYMGHVPDANIVNDPSAKKFMDRASNFFTLDRMGRLSSNGDVTVGGVTNENGQHGLLAVAQDMVGKKLWAMTQWAGACEDGNKGCAASISYLLKHAGEKIAGSAGVEDLVSQLVHNGWHLHLATTREELNAPNKVVVYRGSTREHVGLTTGDGKEVDNSSGTGKLTARNISDSDSFDPRKFPGRVYYLDKNS